MNNQSDTAVQTDNNDDGLLTTNLKDRRPHVETQSFFTVKEIAQMYNLSLRIIYKLIKNDPTFPYINMGLRKKLMINKEQFEKWFTRRTYQEQKRNFKIPELCSVHKIYFLKKLPNLNAHKYSLSNIIGIIRIDEYFLILILFESFFDSRF